jgi:hypothetical protein
MKIAMLLMPQLLPRLPEQPAAMQPVIFQPAAMGEM